MSDHDDDETGFAAVAARFGAITPEPEDVAARRTPDPDLDPPEDDGLPQDGPPADPEAAERLARAARLALNDHGNGQRLTIHKGEDLMFVPRVGWHLWDGCRWAKDPDQLAVRGAAQGLADLITQEIPYLALEEWEQRLLAREAECAATLKALEATAPGDRSGEMETRRKEALVLMARIDGVKKGLRDRRGQHRRFATSAGNSNRITNALAEASVNLAVPLDALDARPLEVNCRNGVLVFETETIEVRGAPRKSARVTLVPHARAQRLSKMIACDHDPYAQAPRFQAFLEEVQPDIEMRLFLQRWFGLSMSAEPVQALAFFYGMGANGKSVLIDVIAGLLADYAATVRIESLTGTNRRGGGDATPDLIPLIGARFARTSEPDQGTRLQEGLIKELTGGEPILVRALHSDFIEIKPRFKLTMSGNHKPEIRGTDDGIWRRLMLVNWPVQIPADRRNPRLAAELAQEGPGILNWLIEGLLSVLENGLAPPAAVRVATEEYRRESDPVGEFLMACCVISGDSADTTRAADLVHGFTLHLIERGDTPWTNRTVFLALADKAERWRHPETGRSFMKTKVSRSSYHGIRFTDAFKRRFEAAPKDTTGRPLAAGRDFPDPDHGL